MCVPVFLNPEPSGPGGCHSTSLPQLFSYEKKEATKHLGEKCMQGEPPGGNFDESFFFSWAAVVLFTWRGNSGSHPSGSPHRWEEGLWCFLLPAWSFLGDCNVRSPWEIYSLRHIWPSCGPWAQSSSGSLALRTVRCPKSRGAPTGSLGASPLILLSVFGGCPLLWAFGIRVCRVCIITEEGTRLGGGAPQRHGTHRGSSTQAFSRAGSTPDSHRLIQAGNFL